MATGAGATGLDAAATAARIAFVLAKLRWMREQRIWPNGLRYLWTDAFGVVLLVSLYGTLGEERFLEQAARRLSPSILTGLRESTPSLNPIDRATNMTAKP